MKAASRYHSMLGAIGALLVVASMAACTAVASPASESSTVDTVSGVGDIMPGTISATEAPPVVSTASATPNSTPTTDPETTITAIPVAQTVGSRATGNRVLMIGDSITASISNRYGGEACTALVPLGWQVEVDAEVGRFIDFGKAVLDQRLDAGWDAAVIFLGTNYGYKRDVYQSALHALLLRLVPRPTVLINTSLFRPEQQEVNDAIAEEAAQFTSVTVIDWATITADPSLTGGDNIHLTEAGRRTLAYQLAGTMGSAPAQPGTCLKTNYTNDSAGSPYGPPGNANVPKPKPKPTPTTAKSPGSSTAATTANTTSTTKPTGSSSSSSSPSSSSSVVATPPSSSTPASSSSSSAPTVPTVAVITPAPSTSAAPTSTAPTSAAPTTAAPTTAAPTTAAPTTAGP